MPYANTVQLDWRWDVLWTNSWFKQVSGFTLVGLAVLGMILSLRKRITRFSAGHFDHWRFTHVAIGALAIVALAIHTGFRFGTNLNFYLMALFTSLSLVGVLLSLVIASEHKISVATVVKLRQWGIWAHVVLCWPIPALLSFHVLKTYYF